MSAKNEHVLEDETCHLRPTGVVTTLSDLLPALMHDIDKGLISDDHGRVIIHNTMRFDVCLPHVHAAIDGGWLDKQMLIENIRAAVIKALQETFIAASIPPVCEPSLSVTRGTKMLHRETITWELS
jgi:hypothetical protein